MLKRIYVPKTDAKSISVGEIYTAPGHRVYKGDLLMYLNIPGDTVSIYAPDNGWVKRLAIFETQPVKVNQLLLVIDILTINEYKPDDASVNLHTELGEKGRRGLEREAQRQHTNGYANPLFDAPEKGQGAAAGVREHPLMGRMKEGVPPKMRSETASNNVAVDHAITEAAHDPELQKQMSKQLQQTLQITQAPSTAPQAKRH